MITMKELLGRARIAQEKRNHLTAIALYARVMESPKCSAIEQLVARHQTGVNRAQLKEFGTALADYHMALKLARELGLIVEIGKIECDQSEAYRKIGEFAKAEECLLGALESLPNGTREHASAQGFCGRLSLSQRDFTAGLLWLQQAEAAFQKLFEGKSSDKDRRDINARRLYNMWVLCLALMLNRKWSDARSYIPQVIQQSYEMGHNNMGHEKGDEQMRRLAKAMRVACKLHSRTLAKLIARRAHIL